MTTAVEALANILSLAVCCVYFDSGKRMVAMGASHEVILAKGRGKYFSVSAVFIRLKNRTLFRLREIRPYYQQNFLGVPRIQAILLCAIFSKSDEHYETNTFQFICERGV